MTTRFFATASVALLLSTAALAQQNAPAEQPLVTGSLSEMDDDRGMVQPWNISVDRVEDMNVYTPAGNKVGEVDEVLGDASGQARALVVEVGGFLGMGETEVVVGLDQVKLENDRLVTTLTQEQAKALPRWDW